MVNCFCSVLPFSPTGRFLVSNTISSGERILSTLRTLSLYLRSP